VSRFEYIVELSNEANYKYFLVLQPVFRIHDNFEILVWIRIRILGSMPLTNGSDPDPGGPKTCGSGTQLAMLRIQIPSDPYHFAVSAGPADQNPRPGAICFVFPIHYIPLKKLKSSKMVVFC
jgi:hypothetical protein